jgi:signal transduction histidine kinase
MRAKLSSTPDAEYGGFTIPAPIASGNVSHNPGADAQSQPAPSPVSVHRPAQPLSRRPEQPYQRSARPAHPLPSNLRGEGLLHDARNLISAIGLYCDLLSMPGVLKPEHRQYPEELRLLGTRSRVLIEHLMRSLISQNLPDQDLSNQDPDQDFIVAECTDHEVEGPDGRSFPDAQPYSRAPEHGTRVRPVSLRGTVERCLGLLRGVANGRPINVIYGPTADVPVWISEEAIERILVNLVRNASQALDRGARTALADSDRADRPAQAGLHTPDLTHRRHRSPGSSSLTGSRTAIRISVGPLLDRIGEPRSWPFQHVRLVVEDSGCGMEPAQLYSLLFGQTTSSRGTHGIGFRVVRELVTASNGDLRAVSTPGIGTQVQIEWPVAAASTAENDGAFMQRKHDLGSTLNSPAMERKLRSIPAASHDAAIAEAWPGVN